jgi:transposase
MTRAEALVEGLPAGWLIADTAHDADGFRRGLPEAGTTPVIPSDPARARAVPHDRDLHEERHVVGCFFAKLEQFRRVATRHGRTATNFLAMVQIACAMIWLG